jgi:hypothetical protein
MQVCRRHARSREWQRAITHRNEKEEELAADGEHPREEQRVVVAIDEVRQNHVTRGTGYSDQ